LKGLKGKKMATNPINQVSSSLGYSNVAKTDNSAKSKLASIKGIDSVSFGNNQNTIQTDSLSLLNRKVVESISQKGNAIETSQQELLEINKRLLEKANNINNGPEEVTANDKNYFSAQNTADRIYNFATSFYETYLAGTGKEDSEASRKEYKDIIGSAIDEGFNQALSILGDLPDKVSNEIQNTRTIIFDKLDRFVSGEEKTYSQKVDETISSKVNKIDKDKSGNLTIDETNLSTDYFNELDSDKNGNLTVAEIVKEFKKLDVTKDLSPDLVDSILNNSKSFEEVANDASKLTISTGINYDFLTKNPNVAQAVIRLSGSDTSFSKYLEAHPEAVKKILENPSQLNEVIRQFKLSAITDKLQESPITKDFLENHQTELDNLFNNPKLLEYFQANKDSAKRLVDSFSSDKAK
jgi:hypothetical protein